MTTQKEVDTPLKISVVIPTYNSSGFVGDAISSIVSQAQLIENEVEILIVDDFSNDLELLREVVGCYPYVKIIEKEEKSNAAESRNIGFENSAGDIVFFLDSDDVFLEGYFERRVALHENYSAGVIFGSFCEGGERVVSREYDGRDFRKFLFVDGGTIRSSTISISKSYHKGTLFNKRQCKHQDWGFGISSYDSGESICYDREPGVKMGEEVNPRRMSKSSNISASRYFLDHFEITNEQKILFVKRHLVSAALSKDKDALLFFKSILMGSFKGLSLKKMFFCYALLMAATFPSILVASRRL